MTKKNNLMKTKNKKTNNIINWKNILITLLKLKKH